MAVVSILTVGVIIVTVPVTTAQDVAVMAQGRNSEAAVAFAPGSAAESVQGGALVVSTTAAVLLAPTTALEDASKEISSIMASVLASAPVSVLTVPALEEEGKEVEEEGKAVEEDDVAMVSTAVGGGLSTEVD
jgi:hypothetical protein